MKQLNVGILVCLSIVTAACDGGGDSPPPPPANPPATQSVGGNVSGLTGTVILQNNGGNNLSVSASGSFTFSTSLASGSAYAVTVLTQPTGQTCSVNNGSGAVANANITSVAVNCTTNTYTVSGSIAGLTGTVVLQNNGGDNLSRSANGAFTFATSLAHGANYAVTVLTQPAGQTCAVSSGTGTATANVSNIAVTCATLATGWGNATLIDNQTIASAGPPQIGVDQAGNVIAVWSRNNGTVWANRFDVGTNSWGTATMIEPINAYFSGTANGSAPRVAVEPNGNAWAIYRKYDSGTNRMNIVVNRYTASSSTWSGSSPIENDDGFTYGPVIAVDANGNAQAAWTQVGTTAFNVRGARYSGGAWGGDQLLEFVDDATGTGDLEIQIAMNPNGDAMLTWTFWEGTLPDRNFNVWRKRYVAGSDWGLASSLHSDVGTDAGAPQVAMNAVADAVIVFSRGTSASPYAHNTRAARYTGGAWGAVDTLDSEPAHATFQQVALGNDGVALAVWAQSNGVRQSLYFSRSVTPGVWDTAALVETDDGVDTFRPRIALDAQGNALVVWDQTGTGATNILAARYTAVTNNFAAPVLLENNDLAHAESPQIVIDQSGNGMAVWRQQTNGSQFQIHANRFVQ